MLSIEYAGYVKLLNGLITSIDSIEYNDKIKIDEIVRKLQMYIKKCFGFSSTYIIDVKRIDFSRLGQLDAWENGCGSLKNLINVIIEDLALYNTKSVTGKNSKDTEALVGNVNSMPQIKNVSKIFISHSSVDAHFGRAIVKLLRGLGLKRNQIVFTSDPQYGIPLNTNIFDYLKKQIKDGVYILYLLSDNYYDSVACLNEMGAAWVAQNQCTIVAVPGFEYSNPKFSEGAIDPKQMGFVLDDEFRIVELKNNILVQFGLKVDEMDWMDIYIEYNKTIKALCKVSKFSNNTDRPMSQIIYKTGEKPGKGTYNCTTCGQVIFLEDTTDTLPPCPKCRATQYRININIKINSDLHL